MSRTRFAGLVTVWVLVLAACGGDDSGGSTGAGTDSSAVGGTTFATGTAATGATAEEVLPLAPGELEAGTYAFDDFGESLMLTLGEGWQADVLTEVPAGQTQLGEFFALFHADHPKANIGFVMPTRMVDPAKDWDEDGNVIPAPADLLTYFTSFPMLEAGEQSETTIGGRPATSVDTLVTDVPKNGWPPCGGQCVLWTPITADQEHGPLTENDIVFGAPLREWDRHFFVEVGGNQLWIDIGGVTKKAFRAFLPLAEEVLATVQFR